MNNYKTINNIILIKNLKNFVKILLLIFVNVKMQQYILNIYKIIKIKIMIKIKIWWFLHLINIIQKIIQFSVKFNKWMKKLIKNF